MNVDILIKEIENSQRKKYPNKPYNFDRAKPKDWLRLKNRIDRQLTKLIEISKIINQ